MERNMIGELNMYKEAGIKPNFSDIARRYGKDRHTVAAYWNAEGCDPGDGRSERESAFEPHRAEIEEKDPFERRCNFDHVELSMTAEEAMRESGRCLRCDHYGCGSLEGGRGE